MDPQSRRRSNARPPAAVSAPGTTAGRAGSGSGAASRRCGRGGGLPAVTPGFAAAAACAKPVGASRHVQPSSAQISQQQHSDRRKDPTIPSPTFTYRTRLLRCGASGWTLVLGQSTSMRGAQLVVSQACRALGVPEQRLRDRLGSAVRPASATAWAALYPCMRSMGGRYARWPEGNPDSIAPGDRERDVVGVRLFTEAVMLDSGGTLLPGDVAKQLLDALAADAVTHPSTSSPATCSSLPTTVATTPVTAATVPRPSLHCPHLAASIAPPAPITSNPTSTSTSTTVNPTSTSLNPTSTAPTTPSPDQATSPRKRLQRIALALNTALEPSTPSTPTSTPSAAAIPDHLIDLPSPSTPRPAAALAASPSSPATSCPIPDALLPSNNPEKGGALLAGLHLGENPGIGTQPALCRKAGRCDEQGSARALESESVPETEEVLLSTHSVAKAVTGSPVTHLSRSALCHLCRVCQICRDCQVCRVCQVCELCSVERRSEKSVVACAGVAEMSPEQCVLRACEPVQSSCSVPCATAQTEGEIQGVTWLRGLSLLAWPETETQVAQAKPENRVWLADPVAADAVRVPPPRPGGGEHPDPETMCAAQRCVGLANQPEQCGALELSPPRSSPQHRSHSAEPTACAWETMVPPECERHTVTIGAALRAAAGALHDLLLHASLDSARRERCTATLEGLLLTLGDERLAIGGSTSSSASELLSLSLTPPCKTCIMQEVDFLDQVGVEVAAKPCKLQASGYSGTGPEQAQHLAAPSAASLDPVNAAACSTPSSCCPASTEPSLSHWMNSCMGADPGEQVLQSACTPPLATCAWQARPKEAAVRPSTSWPGFQVVVTPATLESCVADCPPSERIDPGGCFEAGGAAGTADVRLQGAGKRKLEAPQPDSHSTGTKFKLECKEEQGDLAGAGAAATAATAPPRCGQGVNADTAAPAPYIKRQRIKAENSGYGVCEPAAGFDSFCFPRVLAA